MRPAGQASLRLSQWLFGSFRFASTQQGWQVSSFGQCRDTRGVITLGHLEASGYRSINISQRNWFVHRVVKITFDGPSLCKQAWQVHHKDGNRANNRLDNLDYVTNTQNTRYSYELNPSRQRSAAKQSKPVMWRADGSQSWTLCPSIRLAAKQLGVSTYTVWRCCHHHTSGRGIEFRFQKVDIDMQISGETWRPMRDPMSGQEVPRRMVSSFGRITTQFGLVHNGYLNRTGYFTTGVSFNCKRRNERVHRLVLFSFHGPPPTTQHICVNHKDGNKSNNAIANLEWSTQAENLSHYFANSALCCRGRRGRPVWSRPHGSNDQWTWHSSITSCADSLGLNLKSISRCLRNGANHFRGHEFRPANPKGVTSLPGEEWREINLEILMQDRALRKHIAYSERSRISTQAIKLLGKAIKRLSY